MREQTKRAKNLERLIFLNIALQYRGLAIGDDDIQDDGRRNNLTRWKRNDDN